jgi:hypothetical protein
MNIVLTCIQNFQDYILINIRQLIHLGHKRIFIVTNREFFERFAEFQDKIILVAVEDLNCSNYIDNSGLDRNFRDGFWMLTSARLFYVYECMKKYEITDVIHLENDVMIYYNCDEFFNNKVDNTKIYIPFDSFERNIVSIMYIPNHDVFHTALQHYDFTKNDMYNFAIIKNRTSIIENLPIFITDASQNEEYQFVTQNFNSFQMIFDAAAMGQYLGGIDPRNQEGDTRGFANETCVIKYNNYTFYHLIINEIARPFIMVQDELYPIFNLHIHSKNLHQFASFDGLINILPLYSKKCIAVLTRGYTNINDYNKLIQRNEYIRANLIDKNTEIIMFHEGNIEEDHQSYIQKHTPELNIIFININNGKAFKKEKENINYNEETKMFGCGYRHMCSFWFVDFWTFLEKYDYVIRIDEDCFVEFNIDELFNDLKTNKIITGKMEKDHDFVTRGMNEFTLDFVRENMNPNYNFPFRTPIGPYTNVIALNLAVLRTNTMLKKYIKRVDESNQIYFSRWGDLPLWGQAVEHILPNNWLILKNLRYYHESHNVIIN